MPKIVTAKNAKEIEKVIQSLPKKTRAGFKPKYDQDKSNRDEAKVLDFFSSVHVRSRLPKGMPGKAAQEFLEWQHDNVARPDQSINKEFIDKKYPTNYQDVGVQHRLFNLGADPKQLRYGKLMQMEEKARAGFEISQLPEYQELDHHVVSGRWWANHYAIFGKLLALGIIVQTVHMLQYTEFINLGWFASLYDLPVLKLFSDNPIGPEDLAIPNYAVVQKDENGRYFIAPEDLEAVKEGKIPDWLYHVHDKEGDAF